MFSVQRILVPVDFSVTSRAAISLGIQLAHRYEAKLYFLHTE
ncbi:MAG TPA: universal stress protein, partial [Myxococcales bacterium]|nr:universal stress protein [Myxococcales bacterium]